MKTVGVSEAKTHLFRLLAQVANGERIIIEKRGVPMAILTATNPDKRKAVPTIIAEIKRFRAWHRLGSGMAIRELIEEGRPER